MKLRWLAIVSSGAWSGPALADWQLNLQRPDSIIAQRIYDLHSLILLICLVIFIAVFGTMFYALFKHRKSVGHAAHPFHENTTVEVIWTVIPFLILVGMAWPATKTILAQKDTSDPDLTIKITGYQWKWGYDYIDGPGKGIGFYSTLTTPMSQVFGHDPRPDDYLLQVDHPLVVPVGEKVRIMTTAADVIHGWYVPAFGVQMDAIPGEVRDTWFTANKVGTYYGQCAQICGKGHAFMPIVVKVVSKEDYLAWVKSTEDTLKKNGGVLPPSGAAS